MKNLFFTEDLFNYEEQEEVLFSRDYTEEEFESLLNKYDIDLKEEEKEQDEYIPMLKRHG